MSVVCAVVALAIALAAPALTLASCGKPPETAASASLPTPAASIAAKTVVSWGEAPSRVGETVIVEGPVVSVSHAGSGAGAVALLNIGLDAPDPSRFVAVIASSLVRRFPTPLDSYVGRLVHVSGKIIHYDGLTSARVTSPKAIKIVQ